ncbi:hypothetical protein SETIT_9G543900v2 [Setaria italica]|uniref:Secreted protein n=1 Tax=Setaria italica TaxID=4555 RepID=A0A368SVX8_SETIT|nr:hypothetical protein SETIT_9G543900v2 [Setaria italica]
MPLPNARLLCLISLTNSRSCSGAASLSGHLSAPRRGDGGGVGVGGVVVVVVVAVGGVRSRGGGGFGGRIGVGGGGRSTRRRRGTMRGEYLWRGRRGLGARSSGGFLFFFLFPFSFLLHRPTPFWFWLANRWDGALTGARR